MHHLHRVASEHECNNMTASNLAIVFGPTLLKRNESVASLTTVMDTMHQVKCLKKIEHFSEFDPKWNFVFFSRRHELLSFWQFTSMTSSALLTTVCPRAIPDTLRGRHSLTPRSTVRSQSCPSQWGWLLVMGDQGAQLVSVEEAEGPAKGQQRSWWGLTSFTDQMTTGKDIFFILPHKDLWAMVHGKVFYASSWDKQSKQKPLVWENGLL